MATVQSTPLETRAMKRSLVKKQLTHLVIPIAGLLCYMIVMQVLQAVYNEKLETQIGATRIIALASQIQLACTDVILCGFAKKITHTPTDRAPVKYLELVKSHSEICNEIASEPNSPDKTRKLALIREVKLLCDKIVKLSNELEPPSTDEGEFGALIGRLQTFNKLRFMFEKMGEDINEFDNPYRELEKSSRRDLKNVKAVMDVFSSLGPIAIALAFAFFIWLVRDMHGSIKVLMLNTDRMARSLPLVDMKDTGDELGVLDREFRAMKAALDAANRRTRATIDNAGDIICVVDSSCKILDVNPAASKLLGWPRETLKGAGISALIADQDLEAAMLKLTGAVKQSGKVDFDCHLKTENDSRLFSEWTVQWSAGEQELFCVIHDLTERKRIEQMKQEFFDMVSHDMRTPLSSIVLGVQGVTQSETLEIPDAATSLLRKVENNALLLIRLVNDLLDMDKVETGKIQLRFAQFSLKGTCEEAIDIVAALAERRKIIITPPAGDLEIVADPDRVLRIIVNLLANAIKFSAKKGTVELTFQHTGENVEVTVQDHGRGIPPELCQAVFDRFTQVAVSDSTKKGGSGLGLAICKGFVELHAGEIGVDSEVGKGSRFWFRLPIRKIEDVHVDANDDNDDDDDHEVLDLEAEALAHAT